MALDYTAAMGMLRFLLALAVLFYHMSGFALFGLPFADLAIRPIDGKPAVEAFFIISGFAMAGALSTRYRDSAIGRFYMSRVLRLYPAYLLLLAVEIVAAALVWGPSMPQPANLWSAHDGQPLADRLLWVASNLLIVGKELWFQGDLSHRQFVNPAWSLSIELQFYLLIPFLVRWPISRLVALFALVAAYRVLVFANAGYVPATYFSLPWQLCLFLLGVLSYRLLGHWQRVPLGVALGPVIAMMLLTVLYPHYTESATRADWIKIGYWIALFFTLPLLSRVSQASRLDDFLGDLSYPIYLANLGIIYTALSLEPLRGVSAPVVDIITVGTTLAIAVVVVVAVDRPMTLIRRELAARRRQLLAPAELAT
jgi:peptidoglycan/LPS O-acetylase OafA/YrhL